MSRSLSVAAESWPIRGVFTISRGSRREARVVVCRISAKGVTGSGECVPYARYGETAENVIAAIDAVRKLVESAMPHSAVLAAMAPGAARNAVDCALWDLAAKQSGKPVHELIGAARPRPVVTAFTISLGSPDEMAEAARDNSARPLLKIKLGGDGDAGRIEAVVAAAPNSRIILDANEAWTDDIVGGLMALAARLGVAMIEQPLPAGRDSCLARIARPVPVCADESVHTAGNLDELKDRYDAVNIKLDKAGGLSEALVMRARARELGFLVMAGCMVGTSLAMAPAILLAQDADYADLDGPLLLAGDRPNGLRYEGSLVYPPTPELWG